MTHLLRDESSSFPYGALPYLQVHYIVVCDSLDSNRFLAKCVPITRGRFSNKEVTEVKWSGASNFANVLQEDPHLNELLKEVLLREREIRVEPVGDHVRIYGTWRHEYETHFSRTMIEIADRIGMHIKEMTRKNSN